MSFTYNSVMNALHPSFKIDILNMIDKSTNTEKSFNFNTAFIY